MRCHSFECFNGPLAECHRSHFQVGKLPISVLSVTPFSAADVARQPAAAAAPPPGPAASYAMSSFGQLAPVEVNCADDPRPS